MKKPSLALGLAAVATLSLAACSTPASPEEGSDANPVRIGIIASASGTSGIQGTKYAQGALIAVDQVNEAGGIESLGGAKVEVEQADDQSQPAVAREVASKLIEEDDLSAIVGPYGSAYCLSIAPLTESEGVPTMCSGTSEQITAQGYQNVFNTSSLAGTFVDGIFSFLDFAREGGGAESNKIAVLYENGAYGTNTYDQIQSRVADAGYEVAVALSFTAGDAELGPLLNRVEGSGAKYVVLGGFANDVINAMRAAEVAGIDDLQFVGLAGGVVNQAVADLGASGEGLVGITEWNNDVKGTDGLDAFQEAYEAKFDEKPSTDAALGYLGMMSVLQAIEQSGSADREAVSAALHEDTFTSGIFAKADITYDETGSRQPQKDLVIATQLQDGQFVTVWPEAAASEDYNY